MRSLLVSIFAIILVTVCFSDAAETTGTLRGVVRDPAGAIVAGATVLVQHWELKDGSLNRPVPLMEPLIHTDPQGRFSVELPPGVYDVFISFPVFAPAAQEVRIEAAKETKIECDLNPSAFAKYIY